MAKKILVMGLPGSGKTTFATAFSKTINAVHINADAVRTAANDWDFSEEGRKRQATRMQKLTEEAISKGEHVVADFVCPTQKTRELFAPDITIWMDTIKEGRFEDTNKVFEAPKSYDFCIKDWDTEKWITTIKEWLKEQDNE